jgi:hypothetical protein
MTTPTDTTLAASTSQHGSDALFHNVPPQRAAVLEYELDDDTVSLDSGADTPPHVGPSSSSLKMPMPDADHASGSKRKQEDRDDAFDSEAQTPDRKKPKQEDSPDESTSYYSLITPRHMSDEVASVEGLVNVCHAIASSTAY